MYVTMDIRKTPFIPFQPLAELVIVGYKMIYPKARTMEDGIVAIAFTSTIVWHGEPLHCARSYACTPK